MPIAVGIHSLLCRAWLSLVLLMVAWPVLAQDVESEDQSSLSAYVAAYGDLKQPGEDVAADLLALNVSSLLTLGIWRTLHPPSGNDRSEIESATIYWPDAFSAPISSQESAMSKDYPLIVWGSAAAYGDGVVVESYLTIPDRWDSFRSVWVEQVDGHRVMLKLPKHVYQLGSFSVPSSFVASYSLPNALVICPKKMVRCDGPSIGPGMTAVKHDGNWSKVVDNNGARGWIYAPTLPLAASTVAPFVGGMIAYYRGEFDYAAILFRTVVSMTDAPEQLKADARSLALCANARSGSGPTGAALGADMLPAIATSRFDAQVAIMSNLRIASQSRDIAKKQSAIKSARKLLVKYASYFDAGDPWLSEVDAIVG